MNKENNDTTELTENYQNIRAQLPSHVQLVAVSKTHSADMIKQIYDLGQRVFGENKVQEMVEKQALLPHDIAWHIIGHLQTNKVKYIAPFVDTIQSVDSEKLLAEIDKQAQKNERKIKILLQIKIAEEDSKYGLEISEAAAIFKEYREGKFSNVEITGLMGLATYTQNQEQVRKEFTGLKNIFEQFSAERKLQTLSMGMSDDFKLAIDCGANSVRIGSAIFGHRNYDL